MFPKNNNTNIFLFSIHIHHSFKLACFEICKIIRGNFKRIDFGYLVYIMPYGFIILSWTNQPQWCKSQRHLIKILKSSVSINFYTKRRHYCIKKKFYTKRRHYCIKKKLLMENLAKNWKILLRVTQCFLPCQFLNKHGFPLGKIFIKFNIVSSLSPRKMGKLKLCLRRWLYHISPDFTKY